MIYISKKLVKKKIIDIGRLSANTADIISVSVKKNFNISVIGPMADISIGPNTDMSYFFFPANQKK